MAATSADLSLEERQRQHMSAEEMKGAVDAVETKESGEQADDEDEEDASAASTTAEASSASSSSTADAAERRRAANKRKKEKAKQRKQLGRQQPPAASASLPPVRLSAAEAASLSSSFPTLSMHRFFTPPLQLSFSAVKGRHVVAAAPLAAGSVAFTLAPYACVVRDELLSSICHRCLAPSSVLLKCSGCHHAHYCSPTCRNAHARLHEKECSVMTVIAKTMSEGDSSGLRLLVRILVLRKEEETAMDKHREKMSKSKSRAAAAAAAAPSSLPSSLLPGLMYADVASLQSHEESMPPQHRMELLAILSRFSPLLSSLLPAEQQASSSSSLLLTLLCVIHTNAHHVMSLSKQRLALALYTAAALMNHSCWPSCCYHFTDRSAAMVMTVTRGLQTADELTYAYCDVYQSRQRRWAVLRDVYKMEACSCQRCSQPMPDSWDRFIDALQCNACREGLLRPAEADGDCSCQRCGRVFTAKELREYEEEAELISQQALSLYSSKQHEPVSSLLQQRLLSPAASSSLLRPHPFSFLAFQSYFILLPTLTALSQHAEVVSYCRLARDCLQGAGLEEQAEYADVLVVEGEAEVRLGRTEEGRLLLEDAKLRRELLYGKRHVLSRDVQQKINKLR